MGDFFADLRSGIQIPQVVMNQGPMPGSGGLPRPLHDTADARINYNSSLLGDLTPYAYGEPGYLSSQTAYLNIPHKIQKIVPVVYLPEAKRGATDFFDLSHPIDDGDLAFALRLDRSSLFCTGLRNSDMRRAGLGTAIDPLINLATVNYILSGVQLGVSRDNAPGDLWSELLFNLDRSRFGKRVGVDGRNYRDHPLSLSDVMHIVRHCIRPFGIVRGSEKQGGQNEGTLAPATWPVSFVVSVTIDGKESNVLNLWHHSDLSAGDDLVLCLKLMPVRPYTLNHYYKGVKRQNWFFSEEEARVEHYVWQLVPALGHLDPPSEEDAKLARKRLAVIAPEFRQIMGPSIKVAREVRLEVDGDTPWQDLGFWHVGRTQVMTSRYGVEEFWHNDLANSLRTNHLDITLQPFFARPPQGARSVGVRGRMVYPVGPGLGAGAAAARTPAWVPMLGLERLKRQMVAAPGRAVLQAQGRPPPVVRPVVMRAGGGHVEEAGGWAAGLGLGIMGAAAVEVTSPIGTLDFTDSDAVLGVEPCVAGSSAGDGAVPPLSDASAGGGAAAPEAMRRGRGGKRAATGAGVKAIVGGSLLKADGSCEPSMVGML